MGRSKGRKNNKKKVYKSSLSRGKRPFRKNEALTVIKYALQDYNKTYALLFWLGINVGLRVSDLVRVKRDDMLSGHFTITTKKNNILESHILPSDFYTGCDKMGINLKKLRSRPFRNKRGNTSIIKPRSVANHLKKYALASGMDKFEVKRISTHSLRKTFATELLKQLGNDEKALVLVSEKLHHSSIKVTRYYLGIEEGLLKEGLNRFDFSSDL